MKRLENMDSVYEKADRLIKENRDSLISFGRELFGCPEPGFKEVKTNKILTSFLVQNGIQCRNDLAVTGLRADLGDGSGRRIALAADMDALYVRNGEKTYPYHSCGHSIQTAVMAFVMKLLKDGGFVDELGGNVSFIATPAEEFIDFEYREELRKLGKIHYFSGKQNLITQGVFDDVDCVISMHMNGDQGTLFDIGSTLAGFMVKRAVFLGRASHSGAAPHLGLNALHGANLCMNAISYMKDQFPKEAGLQIHPVISETTGSVNIIPDRVVLESYIRANTLEELMKAGEKFDLCAVHSAKALGLECRIENETGYMPLKQSDELNQVIHRHMLEICGEDKIVKGVISGASGDVGDLGYLLPTVQFGFSGMKGRFHSSEFTIVDEENAYVNTARVVLKSVCDLLAHPEICAKENDYMERKKFYMDHWLCERRDPET